MYELYTCNVARFMQKWFNSPNVSLGRYPRWGRNFHTLYSRKSQTFRAPDMCFNLAIYSLFNVQNFTRRKSQRQSRPPWPRLTSAQSRNVQRISLTEPITDHESSHVVSHSRHVSKRLVGLNRIPPSFKFCIGSIRKFFKWQSTFFAYSKYREQIKTCGSEDSGADQRFFRWDVIVQALDHCSHLLSALVSTLKLKIMFNFSYINPLRLASETSGLNVGKALHVARADCSVTRCSWTGQSNRLSACDML